MADQPLISTILALKRCCATQENTIRDQLGLGLAEYRCLSALTPGEKLSCTDVSRTLGLSPSRTTRITDKLIERGFLARTAGPDRRTNEIALSPSGCSVHQRIEAGMAECDLKLRSTLGRKRYEDAQRMLEQVVVALASV